MHPGNLLTKINNSRLTKILLLISILIVVLIDIPITYYNNFMLNGAVEFVPMTKAFLRWGLAGFVLWAISSLLLRVIAYKYLPKLMVYSYAKQENNAKFVNVVFIAVILMHVAALIRAIYLVTMA